MWGRLRGFRPGLAAALGLLVATAPVLGGGGPRCGNGAPRPAPERTAARGPDHRKARRPPPEPGPPRKPPEDPHAPDRMRAHLLAKLRARLAANRPALAAEPGTAQGPPAPPPATPPATPVTAPEIRLPDLGGPHPAPGLGPALRPTGPGLAAWIRFLFMLLALSNALPVAGAELLPPEPQRPGFGAGFQVPPAGARTPPAIPGRPPPEGPGSTPAPAGTGGSGAPDPGGADLPAVVQSHVHYVANLTAAFNQTLARTLPRPAAHPPAGAAPPGAGRGHRPGEPVPAPGPAAPPAPSPQPAPPPAPYLAQAAALARNVSLAHGAGAAPATLAELGSRLAQARQWVAQELDQLRTLGGGGATGPDAPPALFGALSAQLVALDGLSAGMQALLDGYQAGLLNPAEAIALIRQASDSIINVVNSFRVVAQSTALAAYPPRLAQIRTEMHRLQTRLLADLALDRRGGSGQGPGGVPEAPARPEEACCHYADLLAQYRIQGILGAGGAANVAAYTVATEAAAEAVGVDALRSGNATLGPAARALLAAADATVVGAVALGAGFLVPPPGAFPSEPASGPGAALDPPAWGNPGGALAARCGGTSCDRPITALRARVAGETLAGSILNLVGFILYSVAVQAGIALELEHGSLVQVPGPLPGDAGAWSDTLMQNFRSQALETLPGRNLTALLAAVPAVPPEDAAAFPGIRPGMADGQVLAAVLQHVAQTLHHEEGPTLAGLGPGSLPPAHRLADLLSRFHGLVSASLAQRDLAAGPRDPAAEAGWQVLANLAAYSRYASALARPGALDRSSALALLGDLADTLQTLVYGWLIEASAVPLEVSLLAREGALPHLARARDRALGSRDAHGAGERGCRDWCRYLDLRAQAATETTSRGATRIYLAAYIEALTGSIITQAVDAAAAFSPPAAAGNGTWAAPAGQVQAESVGAQASAPGAAPAPAATPGTTPAPVAGPLAPAALEALLADPLGPAAAIAEPEALLETACATVRCEDSFSRQQAALAEETRSGGELTFLAYTLNLVVKAFRIVLAAER